MFWQFYLIQGRISKPQVSYHEQPWESCRKWNLIVRQIYILIYIQIYSSIETSALSLLTQNAIIHCRAILYISKIHRIHLRSHTSLFLPTAATSRKSHPSRGTDSPSKKTCKRPSPWDLTDKIWNQDSTQPNQTTEQQIDARKTYCSVSTFYCFWIFQMQSTEQPGRVVMTTRLLLYPLEKGHGVNFSQQNSTQFSYSLHCHAKCDVPRLNAIPGQH